MKISKLILFTFLGILLVSCKDNNLSGPNSAVLSVKVFDREGNPYGNSLISVLAYYCNGNFRFIDSVNTNINGEFSTPLLEGVYHIDAVAQDGLVAFTDKKDFILIGGENKTINLSPLKQCGNLAFKICIGSAKSPIPDVNVTLITKYLPDYKNTSFDEMMKYKYRTLVTNSVGYVNFENLPLDIVFRVIVYFDSDNWFYNHISNYKVTNNSHSIHNIIVTF